MQLLFEFPLAQILLILSFLCFSKLPRRIEVLYYKDNISKGRYFSSFSDIIVVVGVIYIGIYYIIENGLHTFFGFFYIIVIMLFLLQMLFSKYQFLHNKKAQKHLRHIYYGLPDVSKEINHINNKYPCVTIKKSNSNAPLLAIFKGNEKIQVDDLISKVKEESSIFEDLSHSKYKYQLCFYILMYSISLIYLVLMFEFWVPI